MVKKMKADRAYKIKKLLVDAVYPNRCPFCGRVIPFDEYFHEECLSCLNIPESNYGSVVSVCLYDEKSKEYIFKAKENGDGCMISAAARLLADKLIVNGFSDGVNVITSIPARKTSLGKRGYCFPFLMAKEIGKLLGLPYNGKLLKHLNKNMPQKELSAAERRVNMREAFSLGKGAKIKIKIKGLKVLLIDDVSVTGATLDSAMELLLENGASEVVRAAFAFTDEAK